MYYKSLLDPLIIVHILSGQGYIVNSKKITKSKLIGFNRYIFKEANKQTAISK